MKLLNLAILKLLFSLIPGILLGFYYPGTITSPLSYLILMLLACLLGLSYLHNARWLFELLCFLFFGMIGYTTLQHPETGFHRRLEEAVGKNRVLLEFRVLSALKNGISHYRYEVAAFPGGEPRSSERIILRVDTAQSKTSPLIPGNYYSGIVAIKSPGSLAYPGAFDYGEYLRKQNICFLADMEPGPALPTGVKANWRGYFYRSHEVLNLKLNSSRLEPLSRGLFQALVLGKREHLDPELYEDLRTAGGAHLVALSGLHIGVFTYFIGLLLWPVRRLTGRPWIHFTLLTLILISYVLLTGASASVVRAAVMFIFLSYSTLINRRASAINSLILSAFFLLLFHPLYLFDAGFQLSYTAVIGILAVYRPALNLWNPASRWIRIPWNLIVISIGAQVFTAPLVLYYFGQLPGSFLLTNLVLTPIFSLLLPVGYLAMGVMLFFELPWWYAVLLNRGAGLLKEISHLLVFPEWVIGDLPATSIKAIILLYLLLFCIVLGYYRRKYILVALLLAITLQGGYIFNLRKKQEGSLHICHRYGQSMLLQSLNGQRDLFISKDKSQRHPLESGTVPKELTYNRKLPLPHFMKINQQYLFIPGDVPIDELPELPDRLTVLLTGSAQINLDRLLERLHPKAIVADGSNYPSYIARWRQTCDKKNIPFHYTGERGYYILN